MLALDDTPQIDPTEAERIARDCFGLAGGATPLTSERDQNFLVTAGDQRLVLKIANASEDPEMLAAQHEVLLHLATRSTVTPRLIPGVDGSLVARVPSPSGKDHLVW